MIARSGHEGQRLPGDCRSEHVDGVLGRDHPTQLGDETDVESRRAVERRP